MIEINFFVRVVIKTFYYRLFTPIELGVLKGKITLEKKVTFKSKEVSDCPVFLHGSG